MKIQFRDPELLTDGRNNTIGFYEREFYFLSNFSSFQVIYKKIEYPTSEHAYHAQKFTDEAIIKQIVEAKSSHEALKIARNYSDKVRKDWQEVRLEIMEDIIRAKLHQHEYIRRKLLKTVGYTLVEDSPKDDFWGIGKNRNGENQLGKIWMKLRKEITKNKL